MSRMCDLMESLRSRHNCHNWSSCIQKDMVSTAYTRGRSREYQVLKQLRREGWHCSRSAASHGPVDVFAGKDGVIRMIQVKSGQSKLRPGDKETLKLWAQAYAGVAEVWYFSKRKGRKIEVILDARIRPSIPASDAYV
jgi:Holliday junction resolvase